MLFLYFAPRNTPMTIEYINTEEELLNYQLYHASRSERIKKKRKWSRLRFPIIMLALVIFTIFLQHYVHAAIYVAIGIAYLIWYSWYEPRHYRRHFHGYVREHLKENDTIRITIGPDDVHYTSAEGEASLRYSAFEEFVELPNDILLRMGPQAIVLPHRSIQDLGAFTTFLKDLATRHSIKWMDDRNWVWK